MRTKYLKNQRTEHWTDNISVCATDMDLACSNVSKSQNLRFDMNIDASYTCWNLDKHKPRRGNKRCSCSGARKLSNAKLYVIGACNGMVCL